MKNYTNDDFRDLAEQIEKAYAQVNKTNKEQEIAWMIAVEMIKILDNRVAMGVINGEKPYLEDIGTYILRDK